METSISKIFFEYWPMIALSLFVTWSCNGQQAIKITPLKPYSEIDTLYDGDKICVRRLGYYTINRKTSDSLEIKKSVDSLIHILPNEIKKMYCISNIRFYKQNKEFNSSFESGNGNHPEMYIKYLLLEIKWINGEFSDFCFYKDGKLLSPLKEVNLVPVGKD